MLFLITFIWMPESPVFLLSKNRWETVLLLYPPEQSCGSSSSRCHK
jgi:hypothetical protein